MSRKVLSQEAHAINLIQPQGSSGATINSDVFSMKDASHATIYLQTGAVGGDYTFTVAACSNFTPSAEVAIAYKLAYEDTTDGDVLGALTAVAATGTTVANTAGQLHVIEIDAEDLPEGYPDVYLKLAGLNNTTYVSAIAILTGLAYAGDENRTQIA